MGSSAQAELLRWHLSVPRVTDRTVTDAAAASGIYKQQDWSPCPLGPRARGQGGAGCPPPPSCWASVMCLSPRCRVSALSCGKGGQE